MDDIEKFKLAVERHLTETGTSPSGFGKKFAQDPNFVFRLRQGREPRRAVRERILTAMQNEQVSCMSRFLPPDADGEIVRAAMWLADIARWPDEPADVLVHRFDLKYWQARKAVEKARRMQLLRRIA